MCDTLSGFSRLSSDFNRGYTKAIQDLAKEVKSVQVDLRAHKKNINYKTLEELLSLFLEHRENFRENRDGFIRYNVQKTALEFYTNQKGKTFYD